MRRRARGYDAEAPIKISSRIDVPRPFSEIKPGRQLVGGEAQQLARVRVGVRDDAVAADLHDDGPHEVDQRVVAFGQLDDHVLEDRAVHRIEPLADELVRCELLLQDGNHRYEALNRAGEDKAWILIWFTSEADRRAAFPGWQHDYNHHRPHTATGKISKLNLRRRLAERNYALPG